MIWFCWCHLSSYALEVIIDCLRLYLGISLRLGNIGMTKHLAHVFDAGTIAKHPCGERMTGEMGVESRLDPRHLSERFQMPVVVGIIDLWYFPSVLFENLNGRR